MRVLQLLTQRVYRLETCFIYLFPTKQQHTIYPPFPNYSQYGYIALIACMNGSKQLDKDNVKYRLGINNKQWIN